jgi:hypothetical protein
MTTTNGPSDPQSTHQTADSAPRTSSDQALAEPLGQAPNGSGAEPAAQPGTGGGPKSPPWKLLISGLLIALVMTTIMVTTYVQAEHGVVAHNLPWGQVGQSSLTSAVQQKVSLKIHTYANQSDLETAANHTKIYGGFVASTNTLIISEAASLWAPGTMPAYYEEAAKAQGQTLSTPVVINKLPKQDPLGSVPGLVGFVLTVAGYLASTMAMQRTGRASARRRVLSLICYAIIASLVFNLIVGPILGAYPNVGSNFWPLWGEFALMCLTAALLAATLQSLIGPFGTLATVVILVFFGNPSTGGVNGTAYLPPFWQFLGPILPPWNGMTLIRNTLYFHGNAITQQLIVLSIYVIVGAALVTVFSWGRLLWWRGPKSRPRPPRHQAISPQEEVGVAAVPPG